MARLLAKWLDGYRNGQVSGDCSQHFQGRGDLESTATPRQKIETAGHMGVSVVIGVPQNGWFIYIYTYGKSHLEMDDFVVPLFQEISV